MDHLISLSKSNDVRCPRLHAISIAPERIRDSNTTSRPSYYSVRTTRDSCLRFFLSLP